MPVWVSFAAFVYTFIGSWRPSFWFDEAATVSAVNRTPGQLWEMLSTIDAVHGAYYFLVKGWASIFGISELSLRFPSIVAIALSTGVLFALVRRLVEPRAAFMAALIFLVLPRIQYIGIDIRSYAFSILTVLLATYTLVLIRERPRASLWVGYAACGVASALLSFYTVFMLVAHAGYILIDRKLRRQFLAFLGAALAWVIPAGALAAVASSQRFQIAWIPGFDGGTILEVFFLQFFNDSYYFKDSAFSPPPIFGEISVMYILGVVVWILAVIGFSKHRTSATAWLGLLWALAPPLVALLISWILNGSYYLPRYCSFAIPGIAVLASLAFTRQSQENTRTSQRSVSHVIAAPWGQALVAILLLLITIPTYLGQRTTYGKSPDDNYRFIADILRDNASLGDAFVLDGKFLSPAPRGYPDSFQQLADPTLDKTALETASIYDRRFKITESQEKITQYPTVWVVSQQNEAPGIIEPWGYTSTEQYTYRKTVITKLQKR